MQVRVVREGLPPTVQHTEEANLRTRCFGSAAMVRNVSDAARNRMSYITVWFWNAMTSISAGTVNTTWKYGTSSKSLG